MKKILLISVLMLFCANFALANDFQTFYNNGQNLYNTSQYTGAIVEFKKALRINFKDNSARIGLVNSYLARGTYYANSQNDYDRAANDFRSALFYLKYYPDDKEVNDSANAIATTTDNLDQCMKSRGQSKLPQERYNRGVVLRKNGDLAAGGYELMQVISSSDKELQKKAYANVAEIMAVLDNTPKAIVYYQKAVATDPNNISLRLNYARLLDKLHKDDLAVQEYNYILSKGASNTEVLTALEKIYLKKLASDSKNAQIYANLGAIYQKQKKYDEAINYYKQAEKLEPTSVTTRLNIGTLYQQKKDFTSALSAYNSVLALYPNNLEANLYRANVLAESGEKEEALKAYRKVLDIEPTNIEAKRAMFDILKDTMTPEQMIKTFSADAAVDRSTIEAMYDYALDLHKDKKLDSAITCYNEILKYDTNNPEVYANLALAYSEKKDYTKASALINTAKTKFPSNSAVKTAADTINKSISENLYTEANTYFTNSEYQKALDAYLKINPQPKDVLIAIAACYKGLDNIDKSIEYYKKAFAVDKTNSDVAYYIGVLYAEKENWTSAKIYLQTALKLNPKNENADDLLATVVEQNNILLINKVIDKYNAKDYDNALKIISQILTEDKKNAYAYYYRGLIYDAQQKPLQAINEYKQAIAHNSELILADYLIATAYDSLGQYANAYAYYKKFVMNSKTNDQYKQYSQTRLNDLKSYATK